MANRHRAPKQPPPGERARRLVLGYEDGTYSLREVYSALIAQGASETPTVLAPLIPKDMLDDMARACVSPPASPAEILIIGGSSSWPTSEPIDYEARRRAAQQRHFDGVWAWHRFFYPTSA